MARDRVVAPVAVPQEGAISAARAGAVATEAGGEASGVPAVTDTETLRAAPGAIPVAVER